MLIELRRILRQSRASILGWGASLAIYGLLILTYYDKALAQKAVIQRSIEAMPREMLAFFGNQTSIFTPAGYLSMYFFSMMPIIVGIFAVLAGSRLLAEDEERGVLDLVLAHPIRRGSLFGGRFLGFSLTQLAILVVIWLGFILVKPKGFDIGIPVLSLPFLSLYAELLLFGALAVLLSMVLPSRGLAASMGGLVLAASYLLSSLVNLNPGLTAIDRFSPLHYYQGGGAINGLNWAWLAGLLGTAAVFAGLAWWRFTRRDIRVAGERGWRALARRKDRGRQAAA